MTAKRQLLRELGVDLTTILMRTLGIYLVSRDLARQIAETVIREQHGEGELALQQPLTIDEDAEHWFIKGSRQAIPAPVGDLRLNFGHVEMTIAKADGQIMKFYRTHIFPTSRFSAEDLARMSPEERAKLSSEDE